MENIISCHFPNTNLDRCIFGLEKLLTASIIQKSFIKCELPNQETIQHCGDKKSKCIFACHTLVYFTCNLLCTIWYSSEVTHSKRSEPASEQR